MYNCLDFYFGGCYNYFQVVIVILQLINDLVNNLGYLKRDFKSDILYKDYCIRNDLVTDIKESDIVVANNLVKDIDSCIENVSNFKDYYLTTIDYINSCGLCLSYDAYNNMLHFYSSLLTSLSLLVRNKGLVDNCLVIKNILIYIDWMLTNYYAKVFNNYLYPSHSNNYDLVEGFNNEYQLLEKAILSDESYDEYVEKARVMSYINSYRFWLKEKDDKKRMAEDESLRLNNYDVLVNIDDEFLSLYDEDDYYGAMRYFLGNLHNNCVLEKNFNLALKVYNSLEKRRQQ